VASDDGKFALVEFVARDRAAFREVTAANRPDVRIFHKGRNSRAEIETEFRRYRRSFSMDQLRTILPGPDESRRYCSCSRPDCSRHTSTT
jgi:hypothetical protein